MSKKTDIKRCPFCGGEAHIVKTKDLSGWWYGECKSSPCFSRQLASPTEEQAIEMLNKRYYKETVNGDVIL